MSNTLQHTINAELLYQLARTALDAAAPNLGGHERMILDEQYETICRFLDHPHAVPEPLPLRPEQLVRGRRYLR